MRKAAVIAAAASAVLLSACSGGGSRPSEAQVSKAISHYVSDSFAKLPTCASLTSRKDWYKVADSDGCRQGDTIESVASFDCPAGDSLVYFGEKPAYWGLSDRALHQVANQDALSEDAGYKAAYLKCNS